MTPYRPSLVRFVGGIVLGLIASFSISVGLVPLVAAILAVALVAVVSRSGPLLAGALLGWDGTWLFLVGRTYADCVSRSPDCDPDTSFVPFLILAAAISLAGIAVAVVAFARSRDAHSVR